jgi:hypothetical protein
LELIKGAFDAMDADSTDYISRDELRRSIKAIVGGKQVPESFVSQTHAECDENGDDKISFFDHAKVALRVRDYKPLKIKPVLLLAEPIVEFKLQPTWTASSGSEVNSTSRKSAGTPVSARARSPLSGDEVGAMFK